MSDNIVRPFGRKTRALAQIDPDKCVGCQACVDACLNAAPLPDSQITDNFRKPGFKDLGDPFSNTTPGSAWREQLEHGEKIGLGTREYELLEMK